MRYLGGKSRYARAIAETIAPVRAGRVLWDPFCGGLASAAAFAAHGPVVCSDVHAGLIALYREVQRDPSFLDAFEALSVVPREMFAASKLDPTCPVSMMIRLGASFGGDIHRGGYNGVASETNGKRRCFMAEAARSLRRQMRALAGATFERLDFLAEVPAPIGAVLYLDPPYPNTTGYGAAFDHERFRERARAWAAVTDVWVSGYEWPADAGEFVWEAPVGGKRGLPTAGRERLWKVLP